MLIQRIMALKSTYTYKYIRMNFLISERTDGRNKKLILCTVLWYIIEIAHVFGKILVEHAPEDHFNHQPQLHMNP